MSKHLETVAAAEAAFLEEIKDRIVYKMARMPPERVKSFNIDLSKDKLKNVSSLKEQYILDMNSFLMRYSALDNMQDEYNCFIETILEYEMKMWDRLDNPPTIPVIATDNQYPSSIMCVAVKPKQPSGLQKLVLSNISLQEDTAQDQTRNSIVPAKVGDQSDQAVFLHASVGLQDAAHTQASPDPSYTADQGVATKGDLYQEKYVLYQSNSVPDQPSDSVAAGHGHANQLIDSVPAKETDAQLQPDYDLSYAAVQCDLHQGQGHNAAQGGLYQASDGGVDNASKGVLYQVGDQKSLYQDSAGPQDEFVLSLSKYTPPEQPSDSVLAKFGDCVQPDQAALFHDVLQYTAAQLSLPQGQIHNAAQGDLYQASDGLKGGAIQGVLYQDSGGLQDEPVLNYSNDVQYQPGDSVPDHVFTSTCYRVGPPSLQAGVYFPDFTAAQLPPGLFASSQCEKNATAAVQRVTDKFFNISPSQKEVSSEQ